MLYYATLYGENQVFCCTNRVFFVFFLRILNIFIQVVAFIKFFCKLLLIFAHKKCRTVIRPASWYLHKLLRCRQAAEDLQRHVFQRVAHFLAGDLERHGENRLVIKEGIQRQHGVAGGVYIRQ